jgi:hypothetical protein
MISIHYDRSTVATGINHLYKTFKKFSGAASILIIGKKYYISQNW